MKSNLLYYRFKIFIIEILKKNLLSSHFFLQNRYILPTLFTCFADEKIENVSTFKCQML